MLKSLFGTFGDPTPEDRRVRAIELLCNPHAPLQEAAAALVVLGDHEDPEALALVHSYASNSQAHPHLQQSAAEALETILLRSGFQAQLVSGLTPVAAETLLAFLSVSKPEWVELVVAAVRRDVP